VKKEREGAKETHLLGSTSALDNTSRLSEDRGTLLERLDVLPDLLSRVGRVDGGNRAVGVGETLGKTLDTVKVDLETGSDDEEIVPAG
jgi:hypothetical protein